MIHKPKTRRGEETQEKILRAAEECFAAKGYFQTVIADITRGADIAPGTFYIYFEDKLSVFRYLMSELSRKLRSRLHVALEGCATRLEIEERGAREFFKFVAEHTGLFRIIWDAQFVDQDAFKAYYEGFATAYARRLGEARDAGSVRDMDLTALSYSLIGIVNFVALKYTVFDGGSVPESAIRAVVTLLSEGAIVDEGAE
ncbi:MAG: TetR/AcrR family transcriptional regulator [Spirochaetes bacterium]|nr:TetR/AcrR family transcriptional regulator [Spirochaetota bacterium]MBU1081407.1 TetR/AcrR family transcriptional regulator [Spirochaetota bacterium]